jgi:hypothetical protein
MTVDDKPPSKYTNESHWSAPIDSRFQRSRILLREPACRLLAPRVLSKPGQQAMIKIALRFTFLEVPMP